MIRFLAPFDTYTRSITVMYLCCGGMLYFNGPFHYNDGKCILNVESGAGQVWVLPVIQFSPIGVFSRSNRKA